MTVAPAGGAPPSVTLSILIPRTTMVTLCRTCEEEPSMRFAARMAISFSGLGFGVCAVAGTEQARAIRAHDRNEVRVTSISSVRTGIEIRSRDSLCNTALAWMERHALTVYKR